MIMSAQEARKLSDKKNKSDDERIMCEIEEKIKSACEEGKTQISCDGTISYQLMEKLNWLGYAVTRGNQYQESYFTVEW